VRPIVSDYPKIYWTDLLQIFISAVTMAVDNQSEIRFSMRCHGYQLLLVLSTELLRTKVKKYAR